MSATLCEQGELHVQPAGATTRIVRVPGMTSAEAVRAVGRGERGRLARAGLAVAVEVGEDRPAGERRLAGGAVAVAVVVDGDAAGDGRGLHEPEVATRERRRPRTG